MPGSGVLPSRIGSGWVTSLRFPPVKVPASGTSAASTSRWCLEPVRARSTGEGPLRPPSKSADVAWVYAPATSRSTRRRSGGGEVRGVVSPTPRSLPLPKPSPGAHPGAADLLRDQQPRYLGHQHEHNRRGRCSVADSGAPCPPWRAILQQRLHHLLQLVIDELRSHYGHLLVRKYVVRIHLSE